MKLKKQAAYVAFSFLLASGLAASAGAEGSSAAAGPVSAQESQASAGSVLRQNASVPLRVAAESLGARVEWNEGERSVTVSREASVLKVWIGSAEAELNGAKVSLEFPVELVDGQTVITLSLLEQFAGTALTWDGNQPVAEHGDLAVKGAVFFYQLLHGQTERLAQASSAALNEAMAEPKISASLAQLPALAAGQPKLLQSRVAENGVHTNLTLDYELETQPGRLSMVLRFNREGQVDDLSTQAASASATLHQPASYDDPSQYTERETVIGDGAFALPGVLTLPKGEGPFPLVILVHGSGPNDRDETVGGAKPFKDLAAGLAAKGIAALRYDKITAEHTLKVAAKPTFSLEEETVADALKAVELAKTIKEIDPANIFIAGHSQGGYAVPLIVDKGAAIKGAVLLAGPSGNISDVLVEQQETALELLKEAGQPEALIAQQQAAVAAYKSMVEIIHNPAYSVDHLPEQFLLGDAYWWIQQRDYQPAQLAKTQKTPLFIAQGENDWQVSMKQFDGWKAALKDRTNVTYASYPAVNHLLAEYSSPSIGLEYGQPSNVASVIVEDVAKWVKTQAGH